MRLKYDEATKDRSVRMFEKRREDAHEESRAQSYSRFTPPELAPKRFPACFGQQPACGVFGAHLLAFTLESKTS